MVKCLGPTRDPSFKKKLYRSILKNYIMIIIYFKNYRKCKQHLLPYRINLSLSILCLTFNCTLIFFRGLEGYMVSQDCLMAFSDMKVPVYPLI